MNAIVDTGFLLALIKGRDAHHGWAAEVAEQSRWPALTRESVLSETAFHVHSREAPLKMVLNGLLQNSFDLPRQPEHLRELALRYAAPQPDLGDFCLIRMSELHPRHVLITVDEEDFRVYRRSKREAIPLLCPPKKK